MRRNELEEIIRYTVRETIKALTESRRLRNIDDGGYSEIGQRLRKWYADSNPDEAITTALEAISGDAYADIIPLYYSYNYTIEKLAEAFGVEPSTIVRNKKRLCMKIVAKLAKMEK